MTALRRYGLTLLLLTLAAVPARAATEVCILVGAGGDAAWEARFHAWAARAAKTLVADYGLAAERVRIHPASPDASPLTGEAIAAVMAELSERLAAEDQLILVLIGHGSDRGVPKFIVDGPDVTAAEFRVGLDGVKAASQLVINTTSASGGFIGYLSAPGRALCTATQSGVERNAPEFMEHLVLALEEGRGDADRNGRLSWAEWLNAGARGTAAWYEKEGLIATENALLDDNGDGRGSRLPCDPAGSGDGTFAHGVYVGEGPGPVRGDYAGAIAAVEAWKAQRDSVAEAEYWDTLEQLLLEAARLHPDGAGTP